jgi:hypothetical protein
VKVKKSVKIFFIAVCLCAFFYTSTYAFEETVTVPAESPGGVVLELEEGEYMCEYTGGAITLSYPIHPNYRWLIGVAVGKDAEGGQDDPDIGTLYFDPDPLATSQYEAEAQAIEATKEGAIGTLFEFSISEKTKVRFWVSDYDYSDNSGMIKLKISSLYSDSENFK